MNGILLCGLLACVCQPVSATSTCVQRWSDWVNTDHPSVGDGDHEMLTATQLTAFCGVGKVTSIECETTTGIPSFATGDFSSCTIAGGLVCRNNDNYPVPCSDYKIRYFCTCEAVTTNGPVAMTTETPTIAASVLTTTIKASTCVQRWSDWVNTDNSSVGDGDHEMLTATQLTAFCGVGNITYIECETTTGVEYYNTGEVITCTMEGGLVCRNNDNYPLSCSDYKIRYFCTCEAVPMTTETPTIAASVLTSTIKASTCVQRWSDWVNTDKPRMWDGGDHEMLTATQLSAFCGVGKVTSVECETTTGIPSLDTGDINSCTIAGGLVCRFDDNFPVGCNNYKIRYFCTCEAIKIEVVSMKDSLELTTVNHCATQCAICTTCHNLIGQNQNSRI